MKNIIYKCGGLFSLLFIFTLAFVSCDFDHDLPEANSLDDETPPGAAFSYSQSDAADFRVVTFANESTSATTYMWDLGNGETSTDKDPTVTYPGEGTYTVKLTASDARGEMDMTTLEIQVVEGPFQPVIIEPDFEDGGLPDGTGDGRDSWRNSALGGVIQITGDPVMFGAAGAKLPQGGDRIGYQEITVEAESNYDLRFWYTMKSTFISDPTMTVAILGVTETGPYNDRDEAIAGTIASITVNDISDPSTYIEEKLTFNSGANTTVAIFFYNSGVECRLDEFTIEPGKPGAVAPSVGFDILQDEDNYLKYTFTNTSNNGDTYEWDFGDGNTSMEESPMHIYDVHDIYTVTLTVTSAEGLSSTLEKTIDIQASVTADFTKETDMDDWRTVHFMDASIDADMLLWEFGDGFQFTGMNPSHTYDMEGTYTVTLTAYSVTGLMDVMTMDIVIAMGFTPILPALVNADFNKIPKNSGSDCACSAWINKDLGEQGESSSGNGGSDNVLKFDNAEPDHVYQEFALSPNVNYTIEMVTQFKPLESGAFPSMLEVRVLSGAGYDAGYSPTYYTESTEFPQDGFGYTSVAQVEDPANNILVEVLQNPGDDSYMMQTFTFNSGDNDSAALFIRGIGNAEPPEDPDDFAKYQYCSGEEEIRLDFVKITPQ